MKNFPREINRDTISFESIYYNESNFCYYLLHLKSIIVSVVHSSIAAVRVWGAAAAVAV